MWTQLRPKRVLAQGCIGLVTLMICYLLIYPYHNQLDTNTTKRMLTDKIPQRQTYKTNFSSLNMEQRKTFVRDRCEEVRHMPGFGSNKFREVKVLLDKQYRLIACSNLKTGSSTITNILYRLRNDTVIGKRMSQRMFRAEVLTHNLPAVTINAFPYEAFMFVRDPLERLLSAYKDRRGVEMDGDKMVSFISFLMNILNHDTYIDIHHMSYYDRCSPCDVEYNYFGTMETYDEDMMFILRKWRIDMDFIPHENVKIRNRSYVDMMIREVPHHIKHKIWERYYVDYFIFGYPYPQDVS